MEGQALCKGLAAPNGVYVSRGRGVTCGCSAARRRALACTAAGLGASCSQAAIQPSPVVHSPANGTVPRRQLQGQWATSEQHAVSSKHDGFSAQHGFEVQCYATKRSMKYLQS